jgi:hypothetical protein
MEMLKPRYAAAALVLMCAVLSAGAAQDSQKSDSKPTLPAKYEATAIDPKGTMGTKAFSLTMYVNALSSDGEIRELSGILKEKGQDGLVKAMQNIKDQGRLNSTEDTGFGMRVVTMLPKKQGGQHVVFVTDRPINFKDVVGSSRSRDFPFGIVVLDVDENGKGTGVFAPACSLKFNEKNELEMERYGTQPYRLENVYLQK